MHRIPGHRTVKVCVGDWEADIDEEIALLIEEIWKADIMTVNSCQENRAGTAWIEFATAEDAARFLDIVAEYEEEIDSLYNRMTQSWDSSSGSMSAPSWEYSIYPVDLALQQQLDEDDDGMDECHEGPPEFIFSVSIRFPRSDLPTLFARLRRHNSKGKEVAEREAVASCENEP